MLREEFINTICEASAHTLVELLNEGKIKSIDILVSVGLRTLTIGSKLNLITEENF